MSLMSHKAAVSWAVGLMVIAGLILMGLGLSEMSHLVPQMLQKHASIGSLHGLGPAPTVPAR